MRLRFGHYHYRVWMIHGHQWMRMNNRVCSLHIHICFWGSPKDIVRFLHFLSPHTVLKFGGTRSCWRRFFFLCGIFPRCEDEEHECLEYIHCVWWIEERNIPAPCLFICVVTSLLFLASFSYTHRALLHLHSSSRSLCFLSSPGVVHIHRAILQHRSFGEQGIRGRPDRPLPTQCDHYLLHELVAAGE